MHVPNSVRAWQRGESVSWEDLDMDWKSTPTDYREKNAYYRIRVPKDSIGYRYESRTEGFPFVQLELTHIGGVPVGSTPTPERRGHELWWVDVVPGVDLYLRLTESGADLRKRIKTGAAPKSFRWRVTRTDPLVGIKIQEETKGNDNADRSETSRDGLGVGRHRRKLEIVRTEGPHSVPEAGQVQYRLDEIWTGNTYEPDLLTRVPQLRTSGEVYPVEIDVAITEETIAANLHDGHEGFGFTAIWRPDYTSTGDHYAYGHVNSPSKPGYWFDTIPIPQGATINSATLAVERSGTGSSGPLEGTMRGALEDDAAVWIAGLPADQDILPSKRTPTVAGTSTSWIGTGGTDLTVDVAAIIEEIVGQAGWAENNAIALFDAEIPPGSYGLQYLEDKTDSDPGAARFNADYTAAAPPIMGGIDGDANFDLEVEDEVIEVVSDGTEWWIV